MRTSRDDVQHHEHDLRGLVRSQHTPQSFDERCLADALLQDQVMDFLLTLPLGGTAQDAAIEESLGDHLLHVYREKAALEAKLEDWSVLLSVGFVSDQHNVAVIIALNTAASICKYDEKYASHILQCLWLSKPFAQDKIVQRQIAGCSTLSILCRVAAASELRDIVADQQTELSTYQNPTPHPPSLCLESGDSALSRVQQEVMQQQQNIAELRELVLSQREELSDRQSQSLLQHSADKAISSKLYSLQRQLISINEANDLSIQEQVRGCKECNAECPVRVMVVIDFIRSSSFCNVCLCSMSNTGCSKEAVLFCLWKSSRHLDASSQNSLLCRQTCTASSFKSIRLISADFRGR